jgi:hypothetical protein
MHASSGPAPDAPERRFRPPTPGRAGSPELRVGGRGAGGAGPIRLRSWASTGALRGAAPSCGAPPRRSTASEPCGRSTFHVARAGPAPGRPAGAVAVSAPKVATLRANLPRAGLPGRDEDGDAFMFRSLRHRCGSLLLRAGESPAEVRRLMRHSAHVLTAPPFGPRLHDDPRAVVAGLRALDFGAATRPETWAQEGCQDPAGVHPAPPVARVTESRGRSEPRVRPRDAGR